MRETWTNETYFRHLGRLRVLFLLGRVNDYNLQLKIEEEFKTHKDLLQGDFVDAYRNLTHKGVMGYKWISEYCRNAKIILKVDDDIVINMFKFFTDVFPKYSVTSKQIFCNHLHPGTQLIHRNKNSKWYVHEDHFKGQKTYPRYCRGFTVMITNDVIPAIFRSASLTPFFWVDDVYLYGLAPGNVPGIHYNDMEKEDFSLSVQAALKCYRNETCTCEYLAVGVSRRYDVIEVWSNMISRGGIGEREISGGGIGEREISGGGIGEREISGGGIGEREISGGGIGDREISGGGIGERQIDGGGIDDRRISGGGIDDKEIDGGGIDKRESKNGFVSKGNEIVINGDACNSSDRVNATRIEQTRIRNLIHNCSPLPKLATKRSRSRKAEKATLLTSSPYKQMMLDEISAKSSSKTSNKKTKIDQKRRKVNVKRKKRVQSKQDDSSDEDEWPCIICCEPYSHSRPRDVWVECQVCKLWAHEQCTPGTAQFICPNCESDYSE
ncbi:hypothetical protein ACF0H5_017090 [Mactra antiquata]